MITTSVDRESPHSHRKVAENSISKIDKQIADMAFLEIAWKIPVLNTAPKVMCNRSFLLLQTLTGESIRDINTKIVATAFFDFDIDRQQIPPETKEVTEEFCSPGELEGVERLFSAAEEQRRKTVITCGSLTSRYQAPRLGLNQHIFCWWNIAHLLTQQIGKIIEHPSNQDDSELIRELKKINQRASPWTVHLSLAAQWWFIPQKRISIGQLCKANRCGNAKLQQLITQLITQLCEKRCDNAKLQQMITQLTTQLYEANRCDNAKLQQMITQLITQLYEVKRCGKAKLQQMITQQGVSRTYEKTDHEEQLLDLIILLKLALTPSSFSKRDLHSLSILHTVAELVLVDHHTFKPCFLLIHNELKEGRTHLGSLYCIFFVLQRSSCVGAALKKFLGNIVTNHSFAFLETLADQLEVSRNDKKKKPNEQVVLRILKVLETLPMSESICIEVDRVLSCLINAACSTPLYSDKVKEKIECERAKLFECKEWPSVSL